MKKTFEDVVIIGNTLVMLATFIATLYRIKIERDHVKVTQSNAEALQRLRTIRRAIENEKDTILEMKDGKEFYDMLKCLFEDT